MTRVSVQTTEEAKKEFTPKVRATSDPILQQETATATGRRRENSQFISRFLIRTWVWPAISLIIVAAAYGPMLWQFCLNQWARPQYQYFPFVVAAFIWLLWRNSACAEKRSVAKGRVAQLSYLTLLTIAAA